MEHTSMNIRMDKEVKQKAQQIFSELGLDMTTAINIFLRQVILTKSIPFALKLDAVEQEVPLKTGDENFQ